MKKRLLVIALLAIMLLTMSMAVFGGCVEEEPEPRDVVLELVNPNTGEAVKWNDTIDLPEEGTPIQVRIKDKETGEYLTDDDLPENTVKGSCLINFIIYDNKGLTYIQKYYKNWPTREDIDFWWEYNYYGIQISFDCRPKDPENPREFQRKYKMDTYNVRFYINKSWLNGDDRYNQ